MDMEGIVQEKSIAINKEPLHLPFADDFSYGSPYPDPEKWLDSNAYINAHYPIYPVDYGVATFDVLNKEGEIYPEGSVFPFVADYLTSCQIRLDSVFDEINDTSWMITAADSLYFSFYYQSQGRGDAPLPYDSLSLQFGTGDSVFAGIDSLWLKIMDATHSNGTPFLETDTIKPNDTIFYSGIDFNFYITPDTLFYPDSAYVPWDSVYSDITIWKNIWNAEGEELDSFLIKNNVYFKLVMIPITNSYWFRKDFQFRFYNYGSLSSINSWKTNTDHWHVDKVYLNTGRTINDIYTREIRFVEPAASVVKQYSSMPMYHFNPDLVKETLVAYANNNDSISHDCTYSYSAKDEEGNYLPGFIGGFSGPVNPYSQHDLSSYQPFAEAQVESEFDPQPAAEVSFTIIHMLKDNENPEIVDTIYYQQVFSNYFSYDDGTAERSYGASADNIKMAVQFRSFEADTLRGVKIFFNKVQDNYNIDRFHLQIWNDNNGLPGSLMYEKRNVLPNADSLNRYTTYVFEDTIIRLGVYNYYVGVTQTTFDHLNIGFDRNTDSKSKTFYNTSGTWINSPFEGSLMIRPFLGRALDQGGSKAKSQSGDLKIYPNPPGNSDQITFTLPSWSSSPDYQKYYTTRIYDITGRLLYSAPYEDQLNISIFENGFYIIDIWDSAFSRHYTTKLLIKK